MLTKCLFCLKEAVLTREHLISEPIARALGIDRDDVRFADLPEGASRFSDVDLEKAQPLSNQKVRAICGPCNNVRMNDLQRDTGLVLSRLIGGEALTPADADKLSAWGLSRYFIWNYRDGDARRMKERIESKTVRLFFDTTAPKALGDGDYGRALEGTAVGLARGRGSGFVGFGNASAEPPQMSPFAGSLALQLGRLQVWVVAGFLPLVRVDLPRNVVAVRSGMRFRDLRLRRGDPRYLDPKLALAHFKK